VARDRPPADQRRADEATLPTVSSDLTSRGGCVFVSAFASRFGSGGDSFANNQSAHALMSFATRPGGRPAIIPLSFK
jgi:hypothetical protein